MKKTRSEKEFFGSWGDIWKKDQSLGFQNVIITVGCLHKKPYLGFTLKRFLLNRTMNHSESFVSLVSPQSLCTAQNVNCRDLEGRHSTPLHFAAGYNRVSVVEYLLHHGADVHAKDKGWDAWAYGPSFGQCWHKTILIKEILPVWLLPSAGVWFHFTTPVRMVTTRWPSCWWDTELRSTWPTCGSSRRSTKPRQRANMRSASCCSRFDSLVPFLTPRFYFCQCKYAVLHIKAASMQLWNRGGGSLLFERMHHPLYWSGDQIIKFKY